MSKTGRKLHEDTEYLSVLEEFQSFAQKSGEPYRLAAVSAFRNWMRDHGRRCRLSDSSVDNIAVREMLKASLSRPHRLLLIMLFVSELTILEAAEVLQVPVERCLEMQAEIYQLAINLKQKCTEPAGADAGKNT